MSEQKKIGILGGGQLARMLVLEAHKLGLEVHVLSSSLTDPAAQVTSLWEQGSADNPQELRAFCKKVDLITFESEFVSPNCLKEIENLERKDEVKSYPSSSLMEMFQDRFFQKNSLQDHKINTSPFCSFENFSELKENRGHLKLPLVLKARRNGYDGKGTYILKSWDDSKVSSFCSKYTCGFIAEEFIPFKRELAITLCRFQNGQVVSLPLVETFQKENRCLWVKGPVVHQKIERLKKKLENYLKRIDYIGCITFELFDTSKNLLVNEVAPRVHNSAHHSQDSCELNQFSLHLLSCLETKRFKSKLIKPRGAFSMYNLIGDSSDEPCLKHSTKAKLHWYGKIKNYQGRKMGHLNYVAKSPSKALEVLKEERKGFKL